MPRARRRCTAIASIASAPETVTESITRTMSPPSSSAATPALAKVPERVEEIWIERIRSYCGASSEYTAWKSAGVGCDVVGISLAPGRRS